MTELKEKHPELVEMCKTEWRKHYRSLATNEEKAEAKAQCVKQVAAKEAIISQHQEQERQDKKGTALRNIGAKLSEGKLQLHHIITSSHQLWYTLHGYK